MNNRFRNTPDTSGLKLKLGKIKFVTCFVIGGKPSEGKTKGIC